MATVAEQVNELRAKVEEIGAAARDIRDDFNAYVQMVAAERENPTVDGQTALDNLTASLNDRLGEMAALDSSVGEHDGLPAPEAPEA